MQVMQVIFLDFIALSDLYFMRHMMTVMTSYCDYQSASSRAAKRLDIHTAARARALSVQSGRVLPRTPDEARAGGPRPVPGAQEPPSRLEAQLI